MIYIYNDPQAPPTTWDDKGGSGSPWRTSTQLRYWLATDLAATHWLAALKKSNADAMSEVPKS